METLQILISSLFSEIIQIESYVIHHFSSVKLMMDFTDQSFLMFAWICDLREIQRILVEVFGFFKIKSNCSSKRVLEEYANTLHSTILFFFCDIYRW